MRDWPSQMARNGFGASKKACENQESNPSWPISIACQSITLYHPTLIIGKVFLGYPHSKAARVHQRLWRMRILLSPFLLLNFLSSGDEDVFSSKLVKGWVMVESWNTISDGTAKLLFAVSMSWFAYKYRSATYHGSRDLSRSWMELATPLASVLELIFDYAILIFWVLLIKGMLSFILKRAWVYFIGK